MPTPKNNAPSLSSSASSPGSAWRPCASKGDKPDRVALLYNERWCGEKICIGRYNEWTRKWLSSVNLDIDPQPTHWKPLPATPNVGSAALPKCDRHEILENGFLDGHYIGFCKNCWRKAYLDQCLGLWVVKEELLNTKFQPPNARMSGQHQPEKTKPERPENNEDAKDNE